MPRKTEEYLALAQRTANGLTRYWESWTDYLTTASRLYKYSFADQLMIYAQRPDATACADFDIWNNRMNRYVRRGAKGIALLDKPNNNLAVEYCRAIRSLAPRMEAYPLPRQGANHGEALHSAHGQFASASALRKLWAEGGADAVAPYVPEAVFPLYQEAYAAGQYTDFSAAGRCELALLRSACRGKAPFADIRGVSEGLEHRLEAAVRTSTTYDELLDALTTVRYPRARMRRLAMDAALGCTADSLPALPPYLHLLGGKKDALPFLKNCTLPVSHSLARLRGSGDASARMAEAQLAAADFGTLCRVSPEAMGGLLRQKNIFLT